MIENQCLVEKGIYPLPEGPAFGYVYSEKWAAKYRHDPVLRFRMINRPDSESGISIYPVPRKNPDRFADRQF